MTYSKQADKDIERIDTDFPDWAMQCGALTSTAKWYAAKADAEKARCEHIKRSPKDWVPEFFASATPEDVVDLLMEIQDQLTSRRNFLNDAPLCDLSEVLTDAEDAIFEYNDSPVRERERLEELAEYRADCRREEDLLK